MLCRDNEIFHILSDYSATEVISIEEMRRKSLTSWSVASARSAACSRAVRRSLPVPGSKCLLARGCRSHVAAPRPGAGSCCVRWTRPARSRSSAAPLLRSSSPWATSSVLLDQRRNPPTACREFNYSRPYCPSDNDPPTSHLSTSRGGGETAGVCHAELNAHGTSFLALASSPSFSLVKSRDASA